jgi:hypothetical protein
MFSRTRGFAKAVLDGYEISGVTRLPVRSLPDRDGDSTTRSFGNRRADCLSSDALFPNGERGPNNWATRGVCGAPDTRRGTCGVGTLEGPGAQTWDFSLRRNFGLTERFKLRFQADIFNAFNRTNFRDLESNLTARRLERFRLRDRRGIFSLD